VNRLVDKASGERVTAAKAPGWWGRGADKLKWTKVVGTTPKFKKGKKGGSWEVDDD
jgi:hypothetical protein